jgi:hypothetical protein
VKQIAVEFNASADCGIDERGIDDIARNRGSGHDIASVVIDRKTSKVHHFTAKNFVKDNWQRTFNGTGVNVWRRWTKQLNSAGRACDSERGIRGLRLKRS